MPLDMTGGEKDGVWKKALGFAVGHSWGLTLALLVPSRRSTGFL